MTNFVYESYIPKQDIKVRPKALINEIYKLFDKQIEDNSSEDITSKNKLKYIKLMKLLLIIIFIIFKKS
jgi:hypothetical protein